MGIVFVLLKCLFLFPEVKTKNNTQQEGKYEWTIEQTYSDKQTDAVWGQSRENTAARGWKLTFRGNTAQMEGLSLLWCL